MVGMAADSGSELVTACCGRPGNIYITRAHRPAISRQPLGVEEVVMTVVVVAVMISGPVVPLGSSANCCCSH